MMAQPDEAPVPLAVPREGATRKILLKPLLSTSSSSLGRAGTPQPTVDLKDGIVRRARGPLGLGYASKGAWYPPVAPAPAVSDGRKRKSIVEDLVRLRGPVAAPSGPRPTRPRASFRQRNLTSRSDRPVALQEDIQPREFRQVLFSPWSQHTLRSFGITPGMVTSRRLEPWQECWVTIVKEYAHVVAICCSDSVRPTECTHVRARSSFAERR
jgi:hypothetical protein